MLDAMSRAIHMAIQSDGTSYPDQKALGHVLTALSQLSKDAKGRVEQCVNTDTTNIEPQAGKNEKTSGQKGDTPSGGRSVELSASGQLSGGSRGGR